MEKPGRYIVGDCEVFKIPEFEAPFATEALYPNQSLASDSPQEITLSMHSWIVRTPEQTIIIDTASGNGRDRPASPLFHQLNTPYKQRLLEAGIDPDDVDLVLMTHLHGDHIGWNTHWVKDRWVPLFRNARYFCSDIGLASWQKDPARRILLEDSINPVIEAGLLETFHPSDRPLFADLLQVVPTPGHSHDHASIILHSGDDYALFSGDLMHNELQVEQTQLTSRFCAQAEQAAAQRLWALNWAADHQAIWFSSHFAATSAGYVTRTQEGFAWHFA